MKASPARRHAAALAALLGCLALALLLYHDLAGGTLLQHSPYDSYALQAENWLAGRTWIEDGAAYPWLELAVYNGRYYQSFPPVPGVALLPWVALGGGAAAVPSNLVCALCALAAAAGVYACFWRRGAAPATAAFFAVFCAFGSNLFWLSTSGGVWFLAQVLGFCLAVWGVFWALGAGIAQQALAGFCLAAAVGCRPFYALPLALWGLWGLRRARHARPRGRALAALAGAWAPVAAVAAAMMAYNYARFGSVLEFGHNYLPEFQRADNGQFSPAYLLANLGNLLRPVTLGAGGRLQFEHFNGFLFLVADPLFLLWIALGLRAAARRRAAGPVRTPAAEQPLFPFPASGRVLAAAFLAALLLTCMHKTLGGWQFVARYLVDLQIYPLLWCLARSHSSARTPGPAAWGLCGAAALFNLYGAVYMLGV